MSWTFYRQLDWRLSRQIVTSFNVAGLFRFFPPPSPTGKIIIFPLAGMLSWAVWFKFLLNKVIANTCLFTLTSFSKQSASWKVLEICELCALPTDSRKTFSVNKYMYTGSSSYSFDWGEIIRWGGGGRDGKYPTSLAYNQLHVRTSNSRLSAINAKLNLENSIRNYRSLDV